MHRHEWTWSGSITAAGALLFVTVAWCAEPAEKTKPSTPSPVAQEAKAEGRAKAVKRLPVEAARERARLLHKIYDATVEAMHHHYFRKNRTIAPPRAIEDVFKKISEEEGIHARWISVNTKAMSIKHKPKDAFEKAAAEAIAEGKQTFERTEAGNYRRAGAISLSGGCLDCHGTLGMDPLTPRFAGLVITIPVEKE